MVLISKLEARDIHVKILTRRQVFEIVHTAKVTPQTRKLDPYLGMPAHSGPSELDPMRPRHSMTVACRDTVPLGDDAWFQSRNPENQLTRRLGVRHSCLGSPDLCLANTSLPTYAQPLAASVLGRR